MAFIVAAVVVAEVATGGGVSKTAKKVLKSATKAAGKVIKAGGKVVDKVVDVGRAIAKDPLPVIATVAVTAMTGNPIIANAAVTAARGGSVKDIATAAVASAAGMQAGSAVGSAVAKTGTAAQIATATGTSVETVAKVAASASGSSVAATTAAVIQGKDLGTALKEGAIAGVGGGVGEGVAQGVAANIPIENRLGQAGVAGAAGGAAQAAVTGEDITKGAIVSGISSAGATYLSDKRAADEAARNQVVEAFQQPKSPGVGTQIGQATAQNRPAGYASDQPFQMGDMTATPTGQYAQDGVLPEVIVTAPAREREAITYVSPTGLGRFTTPTRTQPGQQPPSRVSERDRQIMDMTGLTPAPKPTEDISQTRSLGEVEVTGARDTERPTMTSEAEREPTAEQTAADRRLINFMYGNIGAPMGMAYGGREMGAGTSALAQALSVGDPGALYLGKKGKERRPVWNVESLKLSDELGGTYG